MPNFISTFNKNLRQTLYAIHQEDQDKSTGAKAAHRTLMKLIPGCQPVGIDEGGGIDLARKRVADQGPVVVGGLRVLNCLERGN